MRRLMIVALAVAAASSATAETIQSRLESIQTGAYRLALTAQSLSIEVRSGAGERTVALFNGTPFAVSLDRGGPAARAGALGNLALACSPAAAPQAYRLQVDDGTGVYEQWITASCGETVQLVASEGMPRPLQVAP